MPNIGGLPCKLTCFIKEKVSFVEREGFVFDLEGWGPTNLARQADRSTKIDPVGAIAAH